HLPIRRTHRDAVDVLGRQAILRTQPHHDRELVAALTEVARAPSADVGLDGLGHLLDRQAGVRDARALEAQVLLGTALALGDVDFDDTGHTFHSLPNEV